MSSPIHTKKYSNFQFPLLYPHSLYYPCACSLSLVYHKALVCLVLVASASTTTVVSGRTREPLEKHSATYWVSSRQLVTKAILITRLAAVVEE